MKPFFIILMATLFLQSTGCTQKKKNAGEVKKVGGGCEGCEAILQSPTPFEKLSYIDTLPDFNEPGPKLVIQGIIYKADGKTPAKDVVYYIYHTDQTGHYTNRNNEKGWAGRNGYIKGWIKTNEKGEYKFYTLKPAAYPATNIPAHIHPIVKEPGKNENYIDEYLFDDDPFLTASQRKKQEGHGGHGILVLKKKNGML